MNKIRYGWTFNRLLYLLIGGAISLSSVMEDEWMVAILGGYFAAMGLFGFGCAGGYCHNPPSEKTEATEKP